VRELIVVKPAYDGEAVASKRAVRRRACEGKIRYGSAAEALERRAALHGGKSQLGAYRCRFCGGFHLGHAPRKRRTRRADFGK
jgi:hypothetical protein